jgi:hypothetical protein
MKKMVNSHFVWIKGLDVTMERRSKVGSVMGRSVLFWEGRSSTFLFI